MKKNRLKKRYFLEIAVLRHGIMLLGMLMLFGLWSFASVQTKNVTLDVKDMPLREVFKLVKAQTGVNFVYSEIEIQKGSKLTLKFENLPLKTALERIFKDQPYVFEVQGDIVVVKPATQKSTEPEKKKMRTIKGKVTDENGEPIPGANIWLKGTTTGTPSDVNGNYTLTFDAKYSVVVASFVGYKSIEIKIGNQEVINFKLLPDEETIEEVVVTGYQTISKERSAGSYDMVKGDVISSKVGLTGDILQSMEGLTSGLSVNLGEGADSYVIRGITSINSSRSPLFVVDGVPLESSQVEALLNGNDIASITLLKDATAASIWGSQAANGVMVITTKKGAKASRLQISYDGSFAYTGKPDYGYQRKMSTAMFLKNAQEMFDQYSSVYSYENVKSSVVGLTTFNPVIYPHERLMYQYLNNEISESERDQAFARLIASNGRKKYEKYFMSNKLMTRHSISFTGGSERQNFYFSLGYVGDQGISKDWQDRISVNAKQE